MSHAAIQIDGALGEGGGQVLRSSLALSLVTGRPIHIERIRAGRDKPGLLRQHLAAVRAAKEVSSANVEGDEIGSPSLKFAPNRVQPGNYRFSVGTAGSATLVLQTVLPALMIADGSSELILEGGTHNPWAPPYEFLAQAYFPLVNRMGPCISAGLEQHGFYPAGGGRFLVAIQPTRSLTGFDLLERGEIQYRSATALVANLARSIGQREIDVVASKLAWPSETFHVDASITSPGPGNVVLVEMHFDQVREVFTGFGRVGATAEHVAQQVVKEVRSYLTSEAPVGLYLADQLLLPLGIAAWQTGCRSSFRTGPLTRHSLTHIELLRLFLEISITVQREANSCLICIGHKDS